MVEKKTNWKDGLKFSKLPPLPPPGWKVAAWLIKIQYTKKKPEKIQEKKPLQRKKPIAPIGKKKKERLKNEGSEVDVFREIWETRPHKCQRKGCTQPVKDAFIDGKLIKPQCFAHILPKGMYPRFRLLPDNVALVHDFDCHKLLDHEYNDLEKRRKFEEDLSRKM